MISFVLYSRPPSRKTGIFQMPARDCRRFRFRVGRTGYLETTYYFQKTPDWRALMQSMTQQSLAGMTVSPPIAAVQPHPRHGSASEVLSIHIRTKACLCGEFLELLLLMVIGLGLDKTCVFCGFWQAIGKNFQ